MEKDEPKQGKQPNKKEKTEKGELKQEDEENNLIYVAQLCNSWEESSSNDNFNQL